MNEHEWPTVGEHEWLTGTDALRLLAARFPMRGHDSTEPQSRQSRLYLLACARARWARLPPVLRAAVWLGELHADHPIRHEWVRSAAEAVLDRLIEPPDAIPAAEAELRAAEHIDAERRAAWQAATNSPVESPALPVAEWRGAVLLARMAFESRTPAYHWAPPALHDADLLREVFGNPFGRLVFRDEWRTATAVMLADQMYDAREFSAMPILADALQDAGCNDAAILGHCRGGGPHARGCWVLDAVLNRKG